MNILVILVSFLISQPLMAAWIGTYASTSQSGLAVEFNAQNEYLLYVLQEGKATSLEFGNVSVNNNNQLNFSPVQSITGQAQASSASITQEGCRFSWGEAGEFQGTTAICQSNTQNSTVNIISSFSVNSNLIDIPQLGVPNAQGSFDVYHVTFQLISMSPIKFQLASVTAVTDPINALSALFYPQQQFLYLPILAVDMGQGEQPFPIYEFILKTVSVEPFIMAEYRQYQTQAPTQNTVDNASNFYTDPALLEMMAYTSQLSHETSLAVINNMAGDTPCYESNYDCY